MKNFIPIISVFFAAFLYMATTNAENTQSLVPTLEMVKEGTINHLHPEFKSWLDTYEKPESIIDLDQKDFQSRHESLSLESERLLVSLLYYDAQDQESTESVFSGQVQQAIEFLKSNRSRHSINAYIHEILLGSGLLTSEDENFIKAQLQTKHPLSCPAKDQTLASIRGMERDELDEAKIDDMFARLSLYKSENFRKEFLRLLFNKVGDSQQESVLRWLGKIDDGKQHMKRWQKDFPWLYDDASKTTETSIPHITQVDKLLKRRKCETASKTFATTLSQKHNFTSSQIIESAWDIYRCFSRRGRQSLNKHLADFVNPLEKNLGLDSSWPFAKQLARSYWGVDQSKEALEIIDSVIKKAEEKNNSEVLSQALFFKARVQENSQQLSGSVESFSRLEEEFPKFAEREEVLRNLVVISFELGLFDRAFAISQKIIDEQNVLHKDKRSSSSLSFAYYWLGKVSFILGKKAEAREYWKYLSQKYYSSFYGALAHLTLEKELNQTFALKFPDRKPFSVDKLISSLEARNQRTARRAEALLKLGLKDEASCELEEMVSEDDNQDNEQTVRAILLHASGDWLKSIQSFARVSREYRNQLPSGLESILYPVAFAEEIHTYANNLGVDPDLVLAIIRQESVFNPQAHSAAGARGLMQLMPATARVEARHLSKGYLETKRKKQIRKKIRNRSSLFVSDVNLALGIHHVNNLLKKYNNPVFLLTSYNASPSATKRWRENIPSDDILVFIERIPYNETRSYVKLVMRNYFYYKRFYKGNFNSAPHLETIALSTLQPNFSKWNLTKQ